MNTDNYLYDTREAWLNAFIEAARPHFERVNAPLPSNVRAGIGFTSKGMKGNVIAEVWDAAASADGHFEIFIKPTVNEVARICDATTHELAHVAVGLSVNHGPAFKRVVTALGLVGPAKATTAGEDWFKWAAPIIQSLGPMPYGALTGDANSGRKAQVGALRKVECPVCGFLARVTKKHIEPHAFLNCPVPECDGELICEEVEPAE